MFIHSWGCCASLRRQLHYIMAGLCKSGATAPLHNGGAVAPSVSSSAKGRWLSVYSQGCRASLGRQLHIIMAGLLLLVSVPAKRAIRCLFIRRVAAQVRGNSSTLYWRGCHSLCQFQRRAPSVVCPLLCKSGARAPVYNGGAVAPLVSSSEKGRQLSFHL